MRFTLTALVVSLLGGGLIGVATAMLLLFNGRIAGISGILDGFIASPLRETRWRALFLAGLLAGGVVAHLVAPGALGLIATPLPRLAFAGVLVGFGTRLGGGCTSGHGVCGISRGSLRSIVATATFMVVAGVVVFLVSHGGGR